MHAVTKSVEPELSRLAKIRPVTKILQNGSFRENLESMVITYKLSMTENPPLRSSSLPDPAPTAPLRYSIHKRDTSGVTGDVSLFNQLSPELKLCTVKLAVACRLLDHFGWYQPMLTHCSFRTQSGETVFTPLSMLFSKATATKLTILSKGSILPTQELDTNSLYLHEHLHSHINCVITVNTPVCAAIASLRYGLLPLSKDFLQIGEIEYTDADSLRYYVPEGKVIFIRNQGLAVVGSSVEEAFYCLFHVLTACSVQTIALSAGADKILPMRHDLQAISNARRDKPTPEMYQTHFERLSELVTEDSISSLVETNSLQFQPEIEINTISTNPFVALALTTDTCTNPFMPLAGCDVDRSIGFLSDTVSNQSSIWDFTSYLYPNEDAWSFLPQSPNSNSNPITTPRAPIQIHTGDNEYDDLV